MAATAVAGADGVDDTCSVVLMRAAADPEDDDDDDDFVVMADAPATAAQTTTAINATAADIVPAICVHTRDAIIIEKAQPAPWSVSPDVSGQRWYVIFINDVCMQCYYFFMRP